MWRCVSLALLTVASPGLAQETGPSEQVALAGPRFLAGTAPTARAVDPGSVPMLQRRVTLTAGEATLGDALQAITRQTGVRFLLSQEVVPVRAPVRVQAAGLSLAAALTELLLTSQVDVAVVSGSELALVRRRSLAAADTGAIVGRVTDKAGNAPLGGATVAVQGTRYGATSGNDGRYRIPSVPVGTYTVRARYIGYAPGTASVTVSADQEATAEFALEKSAQKLDEVVTTGTVVPTEVKALPTPITIIRSDEIREKNVQRVDQLFRGGIPGALAWDLGTSSDYLTTLNVRGASTLSAFGVSMKTYIDGVEMTDETGVSAVDPNSIDHIEVIRGPQASTIYGSGALNGVMQIFTKQGGLQQAPQLDAKVAAGPVNSQWVKNSPVAQQDYTASLSGGSQDFSYNVGGGHLKMGQWLEEYGSTKNGVYGSLRARQGHLDVQFTGRYVDADQAMPFLPIYAPFAGAPFFFSPTNQRLDLQQGAVGLTLRYAVSERWRHSLTVGYDRSLEEIYRPTPSLNTPADTLERLTNNQASKTSIGYNTSLDVPLSPAVSSNIVVGFDRYLVRINSFNLTAGNVTGPIVGANTGFAYRIAYHNTGYFGQMTIGLARALFVTAGIRAEQNDNFGPDYSLAWAPRVGMSYVRGIGPVTLKVRGSYGRAIRPPAPTEAAPSVNAFAVTLANPNLGPEVQQGADAGVDLYVGDRASVQVTYYDQTAKDLIDFVLVHPDSIPVQYQYQNVGRIKNRGWEVGAEVRPLAAVSLRGTYSRTNSSVETVSPSYTGDLRPGDPLLGIPRDVIGATLSYALPHGSLSLEIAHVGSWVNTDWIAELASELGGQPPRPSGRDYWITYPSFTKYNLSASHDINRYVNAFVRVDDLMNAYAYELDNTNVTPGRRIMIGARAQFRLGGWPGSGR